MKTRIRQHFRPSKPQLFSARGQSQPTIPQISKHHANVYLPPVNKRRYNFYDQISISGDYIKISQSTTENSVKDIVHNNQVRNSINRSRPIPDKGTSNCSLSSSGKSARKSSAFNSGSQQRQNTQRSLKRKSLNETEDRECPLEDRIWQKQDEREKEHKIILERIRKKMIARQRDRNKQGIQFLYKRGVNIV